MPRQARLTDSLAAATNGALWTKTITMVVAEEQEAQKEAVPEAVETEAEDEQNTHAVTASFFTGDGWAGTCCGGPSGVEQPDDDLWARILRTPSLKEYSSLQREDFSARYLVSARPTRSMAATVSPSVCSRISLSGVAPQAI